MKTITINLYSFDELSKQAKDKAYDKWYQREIEYGNPWDRENAETLERFLNIFSCKVRGGNLYNNFRDSIAEMKGQRLATFIWNNYKDDLFKGKYYGRLVDTFPNGEKIPVSKEHPIGQRHVKRYSKILLECSAVLTGYWLDDETLQPIYDFLKSPTQTDFTDLLYECYNAWDQGCDKDNNFRLSREYFEEECENNDYMFTEDGRIEG